MNGIHDDLYKHIAAQFDLAFIVLFGSRAQGTEGPMSNTDILVSARRPLSLVAESELRHALAEVLSVSEDQIDISYFEQATGLLAHRALETGTVLFGNTLHIINARVQTRRRFQNEAKWRERRTQFIMRHV